MSGAPPLDALQRHLDAGDLTCVLCDRGAARALPPRWQLRSGADAFVGPARTVDASGGELAAVKRGAAELAAGEVLLVAGVDDAALWGETLAGVARRRGAAGVVVAGLVRDVVALRRAGPPLAAYGVAPNRSEAPGAGTVGTTLRLGATSVAPGDVLVADANGIVAIPHAELERVCEALDSWIAAERRSGEADPA